MVVLGFVEVLKDKGEVLQYSKGNSGNHFRQIEINLRVAVNRDG